MKALWEKNDAFGIGIEFMLNRRIWGERCFVFRIGFRSLGVEW